MTVSFNRRSVVVGAVAAVAAGAAVVAVRSQHKATPYDDLLALLADRDDDAKLGAAVLADKGDIDTAAVANDVRARLKHGSLADVAAREAAAGQILEGKGWVLPETVALLSALAAKAA
jgi:hypothetical protein